MSRHADPVRHLWAEGLLLLVTLFWGATFVMVKEAIATVPLHWFLTLRFAISTAIFGVMIAAGIDRAGTAAQRRKAFRAGAILGVLLFLAYEFQTMGLLTTTATKSGFITGTVAIWVPLAALAAFRRPLSGESMLGAFVGIAGLCLLLFGGAVEELTKEGAAPGNTMLPPMSYAIGKLAEQKIVLGDGLTLLCAFTYAAHILYTKVATHNHSSMWLMMVQCLAVTLLSAGGSVAAGESWRFEYPMKAWGAILFCAVFATALAFWVQTHMLRYTTEERASVIYLFEPVFAAITAFIVLSERMKWIQWTGAALIMVAVAIPEMRTVWRRMRVRHAEKA